MTLPPAEYPELSVAAKRKKVESLVLQLSLRYELKVNIARAILWSSRRNPVPEDLYKLLRKQTQEDVQAKIQSHPYLEAYYKSPDGARLRY